MKTGQYNLPNWEKFKLMVDGIFDREYYTNHGPLLSNLESELESFFGVKHAICMTNMDIAKMITFKALDITGEVLIPAFSHVSNAQSLIWASLIPKYYDLHEEYVVNSIPKPSDISSRTSAIVGTANFGDASHFKEILNFASKNRIKVIFDSHDVLGQNHNNKPHGDLGDAQIFSFHEKESIINGSDGACVTTNDDKLAARLRNIRSSYGARHKVDIPYTGNGRMSEIQAGLILISLAEYESNRSKNKERLNLYLSYLEKSSNCSIFQPSVQDNSNLNYQKIILKISDSSLEKINALKSKLKMLGVDDSFTNYCFHPSTYNELIDFKLSVNLKNSIIELPNNQDSKKSIKLICELINDHLK